LSLRALGWSEHFADQATSAALAQTPPVRITQVHRNTLHIQGVDLDTIIPSLQGVTVGDWLLFDKEAPRNSQLLSRKSLIKRRAPGHDRKEQLIAANLDTAFVVTSCNNDFSLARLERYVAMAHDAGVTPVIILSKIDLTTDPSAFVEQAQSISPQISVVPLDARSPEASGLLRPWCQAGQTVAFLGSSGVGKSTLTNSLAGNEAIATQDIRASDGKGRHTTTGRQLYILPSGCAVLDTPGMREIQLTDVSSGLEETFADLHALQQNCRFNDCAHNTEPGCAVQAGHCLRETLTCPACNDGSNLWRKMPKTPNSWQIENGVTGRETKLKNLFQNTAQRNSACPFSRSRSDTSAPCAPQQSASPAQPPITINSETAILA
jgi:ribosome biogenesis GTPase